MCSGTVGYYGYYGTTNGYYIVPAGTTVLYSTHGYYGYYGTTGRYYVVPENGYYTGTMGSKIKVIIV